MSKLVIPIAEVQGVDLKTNPLLLGTRKLRFATNLVFEEGVLKTRPGFVHTPLGLTGQFQGVSSYRPARGISSASFADDCQHLALVVDGKAWSYSNCESISITPTSPFFCKGDVNLFQAENYLIFQNPGTSTYWWDGTTLTESPGLIEQHWDDEEVPQVSLEDPAPVAAIPECYPTSTYNLTVRVIDKQTDLPIEGASVVLKRWSTPKYRGVSDDTGRCVWPAPMKKELRYFVSKNGYTPNNDVPFTVVGVDQEIIVLLDRPAETCGYTISAVDVDEAFTVGTVTIENTGDVPVVLNYFATIVEGAEVAGTWTVGGDTVTPPLELPVETSVELVFTATTPGDLSGNKLTIYTNCSGGDYPPLEWGVIPVPPPDPPPVIPVCDFDVVSPELSPSNPFQPGSAVNYLGVSEWFFDITNRGNVNLTVTGILVTFIPPFRAPVTHIIDPGVAPVGTVLVPNQTRRFRVITDSGVSEPNGGFAEGEGFKFRLLTDCSPSDEFTWPFLTS